MSVPAIADHSDAELAAEIERVKRLVGDLQGFLSQLRRERNQRKRQARQARGRQV